MKQSVYARLQLNKCTEVSHSCNTTGYNVAYCVLLSSVQPRILIRELQAQSDLVAADVFDQDFQFLANLEYLLRVLYAAPGHLRDMKQTVSSAQIDECTEIGYVLNSSLYHIAYMDALEESFLHLSLLSNDKLLAVTDDSSSSRIELCDNELDLLTSIFRKIFLIVLGYQACRDEDSCLIHDYA